MVVAELRCDSWIAASLDGVTGTARAWVGDRIGEGLTWVLKRDAGAPVPVVAVATLGRLRHGVVHQCRPVGR